MNALNEIKNTEIIKYKRCTPKQKELLNLFSDLLDTILTEKRLKSKRQKDNDNENENGKTLMSSKDDDENENDKTLISSNENDENENDNEHQNETINQNNSDIIKELNDILDETIDKLKSFEEQIKSIRKVENLNEYCFSIDHGDKELKFKYFKLKLAHFSDIIDENLFKQIFGHKFKH